MTPGSFEASAHFYPRVLNAHIHPVVRTFLSLGNARIAKRYCHLHPEAQPDAVAAALRKARHLCTRLHLSSFLLLLADGGADGRVLR